MKTFKPTDNLSELRIGDTLTLEDGSVHESSHITEVDCDYCSIRKYDLDACYEDCLFSLQCTELSFVFKQIKP